MYPPRPILTRCLLLATLPALLASCGCHAIAFTTLMWGKHPTKTIKAEYPYLEGKTAAILVRAEWEMLIEYSAVQLEVADHVRVALESNVKGVEVVPPRRVVDYQRSDPDWERRDPARIGQRFDAERLIEIDLTQYTTREPESQHLYRGHIAAVISVYNTAYPDSEPAFVTEVRTVYPEDSPGRWGTSDQAIRRATMEAFAQDVAGLFYDRTVKAD